MDMVLKKKTNICQEEPVDFFLNGERIVTFMCTPMDLRELAVGHLYSRGIIKSPFELDSLAACDDLRKIYGTMSKVKSMDGYDLGTVLTSNCVGTKYNEKLEDLRQNNSGFSVSEDSIKKLLKDMFMHAEKYKESGGMHCAAVANEYEVITLSEDVGRHNAVDKSLGKSLFLGVELMNAMIITTGRISSDMVLKAANSSCPIIASKSIATSSALDLAEKLGITVVGRAGSTQTVVYCNEERIIR